MSVPRARLLDLLKVGTSIAPISARWRPAECRDADAGQHANNHIQQQAQCKVFSMTYNPEGVRMGNKVLRQRLRGPALASYYPRKAATIRDLQREFGPDLLAFDEWDEDRLEGLAGCVPPHLDTFIEMRVNCVLFCSEC